eukprot:jgi/Tetstr1/444392/TSEL_032282.t1
MELPVDSLWHLLPEDAEERGFASSSLQLYLERLRERSRELRSAIYTSLDEVCTGGQTVDERVLLQLRELLATDAGGLGSAEEALLRAMGEHSQLAARMAQLEASLAALRAQAGRQQRLADIKALTAAGHFSEAARELLHLQSQLAGSPDQSQLAPEGDADVAATRKALKQGMLAWWKQSVVLSEEAGTVQLPDEAHAGRVEAAWEGMELLGLADKCLKHLADGLMATAIRPIVLHSGTTVSVKPGSLQMHRAAEPPCASWQAMVEVCAALEQVLEFVATQVAGGNPDMCAHLGRNLWPRIAKGVIAKRLAPLAPSGLGGLDAFRQATAAACRMEQQAVALAVCDADSCPLRAYTEEAEAGVLRQQVSAMLAEVQQLLAAAPTGEDLHEAGAGVDGAFGAVLEGEEGSLLAEGMYQVSNVGAKLPGILDAAMLQAGEAEDAATAAALCEAVADTATLLATIPPVAHAKQLQAPHLAALFHNDCHHVSTHLAKLSLQYSARVVALTGTTPPLMSSAVLLRDAGQASLGAVLAEQQRQLLEVLDGAHHFSLRRSHTAGLTCRKVVAAVLHSVKRFCAVLRPVLNAAAYVSAAASLLQVACDRVVEDLLGTRDFDADESSELPLILMPLVEDALGAIAPATGGSAAQAAWASDQRSVCAALKSAAPAYGKLLLMVKLLQARLADIGVMWEAGEFQAAGLGAREVSHMVEALFEDSSRRDEQLARIWGG